MEIFMIAIGIFSIVCTYLKPNFYWESRKAKSLRGFIGDMGASIFYYVLGVMLVVMGILSMLKIIEF